MDGTIELKKQMKKKKAKGSKYQMGSVDGSRKFGD